MERDGPNAQGNENNFKKAGTYKKKKENNYSLFFGTQTPNHPENHGYFNKKNWQCVRQEGCIKYTTHYISTHYPITYKAVLIINFPLFIVVIVLLFLVAMVCSFLAGVYLMAWEMIEEFDWVGGVLLMPAGVVLGGLGAVFMPWVFQPEIMEIHYKIWLQLAGCYFEEVGFKR